MTENEVLGFNPEDLFSGNSSESAGSQSNSFIYKTRPQDSVSEDGHYRAKIKIIYNPENPKKSFLEQQSYGLQDKDGFFTVVSSLTNDDKSCPIFNSWKRCHYADPNSVLYHQALGTDKGGAGLFDKRFARYVIVQILKDKNQPDLVGSFKIWKLPTSIYNLLQQKMMPSKESGKMPIPVMDYLFGRAINIDVAPGPDDKSNPLRKTREISYTGELSDDPVSCINPDGSPLLNDHEQDVLDSYITIINKAWKMTCEDEDDISRRNEIIQRAKNSEEYKELLPIYARVLGQIKEWAPKLDSLGYHEWTDQVKTRVDKWIRIVESGNNPATTSIDDIQSNDRTIDEGKPTDVASQKTQSTVESTVEVDEQSDPSSDLPF